METILVLTGWYSIGLGTAWIMARVGHDPSPWVLVGWIGGGWAPLVAAGYLVYRRTIAESLADLGVVERRLERGEQVRGINSRRIAEPAKVWERAA